MKLKLKYWYLAVALIAIVGIYFSGSPHSCAAQSDSQDASQYIDELRTKAAKINSYKADVDVSVISKEEKLKMKGNILYKVPKKIKMEISVVEGKPLKQITVSDGKVLWQYIPQANVATKYDLEHGIAKGLITEHGGLHDPFKDMEPLSIKYLGKGAMYGQGVLLFEGEPALSLKSQNPDNFVKVSVWVSPKDGLARRVAVYDDQNNEVMVQEYYNLETNVHLRNAIFEFTPPPGVKVEEPFLKK